MVNSKKLFYMSLDNDKWGLDLDSVTHVLFAYKLLKCCGYNGRDGICSLLPTLDREPFYFHRTYFHTLFSLPELVRTTSNLINNGVKTEHFLLRKTSDYQKHFQNIYKKAMTYVEEDLPALYSDKESAIIAALSHLYLDTFNNPVQAFIPRAFFCSGQWSFWENIDYVTFKMKFYKKKILNKFQRQLIQEDTWNRRINQSALVKSLIIRLWEMSKPSIPVSVLESYLNEYCSFLGIKNEKSNLKDEKKFCLQLEKNIADLIGKLI